MQTVTLNQTHSANTTVFVVLSRPRTVLSYAQAEWIPCRQDAPKMTRSEADEFAAMASLARPDLQYRVMIAGPVETAELLLYVGNRLVGLTEAVPEPMTVEELTVWAQEQFGFAASAWQSSDGSWFVAIGTGLNDAVSDEDQATAMELARTAFDAREFVLAAAHRQDEDCACSIDPETNLCRVCEVEHGTPCVSCGGRGYHYFDCPESDLTPRVVR